VVVDLPGRLGDEVAAFVEGEAGWQVVSPATGDVPLQPVLELCAAPRAGRACVVVREGPVDAEAVRGALLDGALDVIGWPHDRARLLEAPLRVHATRRAGGGPRVLRVAGCGGGVGTSTLALAIGGLLAWSGKDVVVAGQEDLLRLCGLAPWAGPDELGAGASPGAGAEVTALARPVPGVEGLSVLPGGPDAAASTAGWPVDGVVVDLRAPRHLAGADLVCARPDATLAAVEGLPGDLPVVIAGDGPLDQAAVRRRLGRAPIAWLPASARVARAGVAGRVPAGLPGTWLKALRTGMRRVGR
jgi:hypothetical protein